MPLFVYNDYRTPIFTSFSLFFPSEVARCGAEAAADAGYALHLSIGHIFAQLLVCGARGIVADAGKLANADVVVCLEVLIERIGQLRRCERLLHLAFDLELDIGQTVEQVLVGAEADAADLYILACMLDLSVRSSPVPKSKRSAYGDSCCKMFTPSKAMV